MNSLIKSDKKQYKKEANKSIRKLLQHKSDMKEMLSQYYIQKDNRIFNTIVSLYTTQVIPLLDTIRELKYRYIELEYNSDDETYQLNTKKYLIRDIETNTNEEDEPRLISNIK